MDDKTAMHWLSRRGVELLDQTPETAEERFTLAKEHAALCHAIQAIEALAKLRVHILALHDRASTAAASGCFSDSNSIERIAGELDSALGKQED